MIGYSLAPYMLAIKAGAAALLMGVTFGAGWYFSGLSGKAEIAEMRAKAEQVIAESAKAEAAAVNRARVAEQARAADIAAVVQKNEEDKARDKAAYQNDLARLTDGTLRLRSQWQGCQATASVSNSALSAALADAAEQLRRADSANLVRIGRDADTKERGLQEAVRAYAE